MQCVELPIHMLFLNLSVFCMQQASLCTGHRQDRAALASAQAVVAVAMALAATAAAAAVMTVERVTAVGRVTRGVRT